MNSQSSGLYQETDSHEDKAFDDRKVGAGAMQEDIELLREQVESLKQMLFEQYQLTNEYMEELGSTKQELDLMNNEIFNLIASKRQSLDEAKELAKSIVKKRKLVSESIAELLGAIYGSPIKVNELEQIKEPNTESKLNKCKAQSDKMIEPCHQLTEQPCEITKRSRKIRLSSHEIKVR